MQWIHCGERTDWLEHYTGASVHHSHLLLCLSCDLSRLVFLFSDYISKTLVAHSIMGRNTFRIAEPPWY